jgi:hypothetical protein
MISFYVCESHAVNMKNTNLKDLFINLYGENVEGISIGSATEIQPKVFLTILHCVDKNWPRSNSEPAINRSEIQSRVTDSRVVKPNKRRLRSGIVVMVPNYPIYLFFKERECYFALEVKERRELYSGRPGSMDVPVLLFIGINPNPREFSKILCEPPGIRNGQIEPDLSILFTLLVFKEEVNEFDLVTIQWNVAKAFIYRDQNTISVFGVEVYPGMNGGLIRNRRGAWLGVVSGYLKQKRPQSFCFPAQLIPRIQLELSAAGYQSSITGTDKIQLDPCAVSFFEQVSEPELPRRIKEYMVELMMIAKGFERRPPVNFF